MHRFAVALMLLLVLPLGAAQEGHPSVLAVYRDAFTQPDVGLFHFAGGCGVEQLDASDGQFEVDAANGSFTFFEGNHAFGGVQTPFRGQFQTACGTAGVDVNLPQGIEHIHVRFEGDRIIQDAGFGTETPRAQQTVRLLDGDAILQEVPVYPSNTSSSPLAAHDIIFNEVPAGPMRIAWFFSEEGGAELPSEQSVASTQGFVATVQNISLEFSGTAISFAQSHARERQGELVVDDVRARFELGTYDATVAQGHVRIRFDPALEPVAIALPDGQLLRDFDTTARTTHMPRTYVGAPLLEAGPQAYDQLVLPASTIWSAGPGAYEVHFQAVAEGSPSAALLWFNAVLLLVPLVFAARGAIGTHRFWKESFGGYRRIAVAMLAAYGLTILYYGSTVLAAGLTGGLSRMSILPLTPEAWLLYLQIATATVAFVGLYAVGQRLEALTHPSARKP